MHLILTGATGLVGSATLHAMLRNPSIQHISIFSRSPVPQANDSALAQQKCTVYTHPSFSTPPSLETLAKVCDAHGCVWALGASTNAVNAQTYEDITVQWPLAWARAFIGAGLGDQRRETVREFNFVYVSGEGATLNPRFATPRYGRVKGRAEQALLDLSKEGGMAALKVYSARAGAVDQVGHAEITKYVKGREGIQKKFEKPVKALLRPLWKNMMSPTRALGDALVQLAAGDGQPLLGDPATCGEGRTISNVALRRIAGL